MRIRSAVGKPAETGGLPESIRVFLRRNGGGGRRASASAWVSANDGMGAICGDRCLSPMLLVYQKLMVASGQEGALDRWC